MQANKPFHVDKCYLINIAHSKVSALSLSVWMCVRMFVGRQGQEKEGEWDVETVYK